MVFIVCLVCFEVCLHWKIRDKDGYVLNYDGECGGGVYFVFCVCIVFIMNNSPNNTVIINIFFSFQAPKAPACINGTAGTTSCRASWTRNFSTNKHAI